MSALTLLISCEHGGNAVPPSLAPLFVGQEELLASHRGYDPGALSTARALARVRDDVPVFAATITRLVVDLNRSRGNPALYSAITRALPRNVRERLLADAYLPHREAVIKAVAALLSTGRTVVHVASHSFTPCLNAVVRRCDVGFLYDPGRPAEKAFCRHWMHELALLDPTLRLRCNSPYKGVSDGFPTALRRRFGEKYLGMELEVNQRFVLTGETTLHRLNERLAASLKRTLASDAADVVSPDD